MQVILSSLKPNPYRDFTVDPIDRDNVEVLKESIAQDGFWGGVVCRMNADGEIEIAAGHHRIEAAIAAGIKSADLFVRDTDDEGMIRIYARENSTQRGNGSTAVAGTVASAIRFLFKRSVLNSQNQEFKSYGGKRDKEIGTPSVLAFLHDIPNVTKPIVESQLATLKLSGDYARIVRLVQHEVEQEAKEAEKRAAETKDEEERKARQAEFERMMKASEKANKAADKAEEQEATFDFEGVARFFKNENQVRAFRESVTRPEVLALLPVSNQAAVAEHLVKMADEKGRELSGAFIREFIGTSISQLKYGANRAKDKAAKEEAEKMSRNDKAKKIQGDFARSIRGMSAAANDIIDLYRAWPKDDPFPFTGEFKTALGTLAIVVEQLKQKGVL